MTADLTLLGLWNTTTAACVLCHEPLTTAHAGQTQHLGLRQIYPGLPAVDLLDVLYNCPTCKTVNYLRFEK